MESEITIQAECLCKAHIFSTAVAVSSLPLVASVCHCTSCRHLVGSLYFSCAPWPQQQENISKLRRYAFSSKIEIFSCPTCASKLFCRKDEGDGDSQLLVVTSALNNGPGLVVYGRHVFVGDTIDGGGSMWLRRRPDSRQPARWYGAEGDSQRLNNNWPQDSQGLSKDDGNNKIQLAKPELTPINCHCGGVKLYLKSGAARRQASLSIGSNNEPVMEEADAKRLWELGIDAATGRFMTIMDACNSCRQDVSSDVVYWAFAPVDHIATTAEPNAAVKFKNAGDLSNAVSMKDERLGTLARYSSSPGINRYHCSICSASIFATNETVASDPEVVGIAVGVLEHEDGARAEGNLSWDYGRMDFAKDGEGGWRGSLNKTILEEAKAWQLELPAARGRA